MGKIKDLTGQQFGYLTVIEDTGKRTSDRKIVWKCKCKCGNECEVKGDNLKSGNTKSCGCLRKEVSRELGKSSIKIIPKGTRFGKLTVIKLLDERTIYGTTIYQCQCDCGNITNVQRDNLISSGTQSCGCLNYSRGEFKISQLLNENNILFEKEKTFENFKNTETNQFFRFDFYIDNKYIIEFDGIQHFQSKNTGWDTEENLIKTQKHDNFKNQYCFEHNIPIIRIPYTHLKDICLEDLIPETSQFLLNFEE